FGSGVGTLTSVSSRMPSFLAVERSCSPLLTSACAMGRRLQCRDPVDGGARQLIPLSISTGAPRRLYQIADPRAAPRALASAPRSSRPGRRPRVPGRAEAALDLAAPEVEDRNEQGSDDEAVREHADEPERHFVHDIILDLGAALLAPESVAMD